MQFVRLQPRRAHAIGEVAQPRRKLHRPDQRVLGQSFIQLRQLLEIRQLGAEGPMARFTDGEKLASQRAALCPTGRLLRRLEDPALERHTRFVPRIEYGIARDEKRVLALAESLALLL